jgi:hypothetical protein
MAGIAYGSKLGLITNASIGQAYFDELRQFLQAIDQIVQMSILNATTSIPPTSPNPGDAYLLTSGTLSGAWTGYAGYITWWNTQETTSGTNVQVPAWSFILPEPGWIVWNVATATLLVYNGTTWGPVTGSSVTFPITVAQGGTGGTTAAAARNNLSAAASGINSDITALNSIATATTTGGQAGITIASSGGNGTALTASNGTNVVVITTNGGVLPAYIQCSGNIQGQTLTLTGATQTTIGAAGTASSLPGAPKGYLILTIDGSPAVIPFWAAS